MIELSFSLFRRNAYKAFRHSQEGHSTLLFFSLYLPFYLLYSEVPTCINFTTFSSSRLISKIMSIMAEVHRTNGHVDRDAPRSPVSISTDSSRRNSLRPILSEKHSEPPTPVSPPPFDRLSRKRAASLDTESASASQPRIGDLALNSASTSNSIGGPSPISDTPVTEQVCLCQPDPKIPRPRNGAWPKTFLWQWWLTIIVWLVIENSC